ncbi:MAG: CHAT domain-containing protein [Sphingopyxis sp.]
MVEESGLISPISNKHGRARLFGAASLVAALAMAPNCAQAQTATRDPTLRDSFPIGSSDGALCRVQSEISDPAFSGMFDRAWTIICRDAAQPVGRIFGLRGDDALTRVNARPSAPTCPAGTAQGFADCSNYFGGLPGVRTVVRRGETTYIGEGLAVYRDAVRLALESVTEGRIVAGKIDVATTSVGDSEAMARVQVANLPADQALAEGYRRNNSGDFAEASVYFEALERRPTEAASGLDPSEFSLNRALQMSNLGDFGEAERLLDAVSAQPTTDGVQLRLRRNFRAMHMLNRRDYDGALAALDVPVAAIFDAGGAAGSTLSITPAIASGLNSDASARVLTQLYGEERLSPQERSIAIDAQAGQLRATVQRLSGDMTGARRSLTVALAQTITVRDGRVTSILRLQAQMLGEMALVDEGENNLSAAEARFGDAIALLEREYPETMALAASRARLAAFLSRHNRTDDALTHYRQVITALTQARRQLTGIYNQMGPYYQILADRQARDPSAAAEFFAAAQLLVRPGVASTQAQLARELSGGSDEAATLFRQANNLARDLERTRIELGRLSAIAGAEAVQLQTEAQVRVDNLAAEQTVTLARLAEFPQYRAVSQEALPLAELQAALGADEAYAKLAIVGEDVYVMLVTRTSARAWKAAVGRGALDAAVDQIRNSISVQEGGQYTTYPFDAEAAHRLFVDLFTPAAAELTATRHVIFEPDGAMLRLPLGLLITDATSVAAYAARSNAPGGDPFDMRGMAWLGRTSRVSTAVSPLAFRNTRQAPSSRAHRSYLGFGNNLPVGATVGAAGVRGGGGGCDWGASAWNRPIAPTELYSARDLIGAAGSEVVTGADFTDRQLRNRSDLSDYRILHFATHGLVTPPRAGCQVKPALLTSFDSQDSDGLLSFDEIFALRLDADLVILSACDTAGEASVAATRAAGVSTGGGSALDGLVRAFIGAGGRSIIASHWPAPDDFDATQRLIGGIFRAGAGVSMAEALGQAQDALMADAATSHPYYWAGFAIIGDGAHSMFRATTAERDEQSGTGQRTGR